MDYNTIEITKKTYVELYDIEADNRLSIAMHKTIAHELNMRKYYLDEESMFVRNWLDNNPICRYTHNHALKSLLHTGMKKKLV